MKLQHQQEIMFDSMIEGLLLLDGQGRVQLANRAVADLFGLAADIRGRTVIEAFRLHELAALVDSLKTRKRVSGFEMRLPGSNERWLTINAAAIFDSQGRQDGTVVVFHDLTPLKQLEKARQEFVANVSHELRTPLSHIKGCVETLLDGARNDPEVATRFLQTVDRNADRLRLLIEDLLTISELESGRVRLNLRPVSLAPIVAKVLEDFKTRAEARSMRTASQVPELAVLADPDRLEQVLGNLVDNAIKYGRTTGSVVIGARLADGDHVEISVQDDGPGIKPDAIERIFERFYRVDKARSREQGGTGLGLSIVKHLVQAQGGRVWASSEPGCGTTFFFTLPQAAKDRVRDHS